MQKIYFANANITKKTPVSHNDTKIKYGFPHSPSTCFEISDLIECLYISSEGFYIASLFNILNLDNIYNKTIDTNKVNIIELFNKCIYFKENIGVFIYFLADNQKPMLSFQKLIININLSNEYQLINDLDPITINSISKFPLGSNYAYNDIIKINDNNIIYISTKNDSDIIIVISIKVLNNTQNIIISYYLIELNLYNIRIYKDITTFTLKGFLGIGFTHYNYTLSNTKSFSSYFFIRMDTSNNFTIPETIDIFDEENIYNLNIENLNVIIDNNIFGYTLIGIKFLSLLNETNLGFYLYSNLLNKKIEINETISLNDSLNFKKTNNSDIKNPIYIFFDV